MKINLCDSLYNGKYIELEGEKVVIPLSKLIELSLKHNLTDPKIEINFDKDYYDGLIFDSVNFVGDKPEG